MVCVSKTCLSINAARASSLVMISRTRNAPERISTHKLSELFIERKKCFFFGGFAFIKNIAPTISRNIIPEKSNH